MGQNKGLWPPDVIILIAAQFDAMEVVTCHAVFSDHHFSVMLVSIMPGLVESTCGVTVHPDSYLSQGMSLMSEKRQLIVLTGGEACAAQTLSDPRTHQLVQNVLQRDGYVAVMTRADFLVKETGLFTAEWAARILRQRGLETAVFVEKIIQQFTKVTY